MRALSFNAVRRFIVVTVSAGAAVAAVATPAQAIAPGAGWAASWRYYATNAFQYEAKLPGARVVGHASDYYGTRRTVGTVSDTAADGRCANVKLYAYGVGYIANRTACGYGTSVNYSTGTFNQGLLIIITRNKPGLATPEVSTYEVVPSSTGDPALRTVNTGATWSYYTPTSFQYSARRPGVTVGGYGAHQPAGKRSALSTVHNTAAGPTCATGKARDFTHAVTGVTCASGGTKAFSAFNFAGWIDVDACTKPIFGGTQRCVTAHVPEPY